MAKVTYHRSHSFIDLKGVNHSFITQLYKVGVYGILDGKSSLQDNFTPQRIRTMENALKKGVKDNKIKSFRLGMPITVTDKTGLWEEVKN